MQDFIYTIQRNVMGSVNIKIEGLRRGTSSNIRETGQTIVYIDNNFRDSIIFDAFERTENTYEKRNNSLITVRCGSQLWSGELNSLHNTLFYNEGWNETYFEITKVICKETEGECYVKKLVDIQESKGYGSLWDFAKRLTDKFQRDYKDIIWDGNYLDTLEQFLEKNLYS